MTESNTQLEQEKLSNEKLAKEQLEKQQKELLENKKKMIEIQYIYFKKRIEQLRTEIDEIQQKIDYKHKKIRFNKNIQNFFSTFCIVIFLYILYCKLMVY